MDRLSASDVVRLAVASAGWLAGWWLLFCLTGLPDPDADPHTDPAGARTGLVDTVAVVIPARNEGQNLPGLLSTLVPAGTRELVVVDDSSTDSTTEVATAMGARVIPAPDPPPGWTGKAWACHTGAAATTAPLLVFVDADVRFAPGAVARLLGEHRQVGGLLSVQPYHCCDREVESLSAFFNIVALMGVGVFSASPRQSPTGAFGPVLVCSRAEYTRVGGHAAVRGEVLEDVELARRFRDFGLPVSCRAGRADVSFRMYPEGFAQLLEGWTKNIAQGARAATHPVSALLIAWWVAAQAAVAAGLAAHLTAPTLEIAYAAIAVQLWWMLRRVGRFRWWASAAWPVPLAFFIAVFARSLVFVVLRRPVRWKGRAVPSGGSR